MWGSVSSITIGIIYSSDAICASSSSESINAIYSLYVPWYSNRIPFDGAFSGWSKSVTVKIFNSIFDIFFNGEYSFLNRVPDLLDKSSIKLLEELNNGVFASALELSEEELKFSKDLNLLTLKPQIYVLNVDEKYLSKKSEQNVSKDFEDAVVICAKL